MSRYYIYLSNLGLGSTISDKKEQHQWILMGFSYLLLRASQSAAVTIPSLMRLTSLQVTVQMRATWRLLLHHQNVIRTGRISGVSTSPMEVAANQFLTRKSSISGF